jgi:hypothetical protein
LQNQLATSSGATSGQPQRPLTVAFVGVFNLFDHASGAALSMATMLEQLAKRGIRCKALTACCFDAPPGDGLPDLLRGRGLSSNATTNLQEVPQWQGSVAGVGYTVIQMPNQQRTQVSAIEELVFRDKIRAWLADNRPDVVITFGGYLLDIEIQRCARAAGALVAFYLQTPNYTRHESFAQTDLILTNSDATAEHYARKLNMRCHNVGVFADAKAAVAKKRDPQFVTFINPLPEKGVALFLKLVARAAREVPDMRFLVVESRGVLATAMQKLGFPAALLERITVLPKQEHIAEVYAKSRILLVPSFWFEAAGRVLIEANANGIPVLATNRGGIPETLGGAGRLLPIPDRCTVDHWALPTDQEVLPWWEELRKLWTDRAYYDSMSGKALEVAKMQTIERDAANLDLLLRTAVSNAAASAQKHSEPTSLPTPVSTGMMQEDKSGEAGTIGDEKSNGVPIDFSANSRRLMMVQLSPGWMGIARLPKALAAVGFRVATFCRPDSFLSKTRYAEHGFGPPATGSPFPNLANAVRQFQPDLLIPGCESAVNFLHEIVRAGSDGRLNGDDEDIVSLAKRSLGNPEYYHTVLSKHATLEIAAELGLRTPQQSHISRIEDAVGFAGLHGYPVVLKGEFGCAGQEVKICATADEIAAAFQFLNRAGNPRNPRVVAQQYVQGVSAMHMAVAASGNVLESLTLLKERTHPQLTGPSSVVRLIHNEEAAHTVSSLMKKLGYTGFGHCDFILENSSQAAYLLEFNPRPGPACGLGGLLGHDLCRALWSYLSDVQYQRQSSPANHKTVALFPNEWLRDPQSPFLAAAYHDVPWDDPLLLRSYMQAKGV